MENLEKERNEHNNALNFSGVSSTIYIPAARQFIVACFMLIGRLKRESMGANWPASQPAIPCRSMELGSRARRHDDDFMGIVESSYYLGSMI